jgi:hypothetical protein
MWGNDPTVTSGALSETWINPSLPAAFVGHLGRGGRLIGPIDDPVSSCLSCHSTAEVDPSQATHEPQYNGAVTKPPSGCSDPMDWFRNVPSATPFGHAMNCPANTSTAGLISMDYSLQVQEGVSSIFGFGNTNPCQGVIGAAPPPAPRPAPGPPSPRMEKFHFRRTAAAPSLVTLDPAKHPEQIVGPDPFESQRR